MLKKIIASIKMLKAEKTSASAIKMQITPPIIGLRTYLYGPAITNFLVGAQGAKVPLPILLNNFMVLISKFIPTKKNTNATRQELKLLQMLKSS